MFFTPFFGAAMLKILKCLFFPQFILCEFTLRILILALMLFAAHTYGSYQGYTRQEAVPVSANVLSEGFSGVSDEGTSEDSEGVPDGISEDSSDGISVKVTSEISMHFQHLSSGTTAILVFAGLFLWLFTLTPVMNSVLESESTPANIRFILFSTLSGTLILYAVTSFQFGWKVDIYRTLFIFAEFILILFLTTAWMSFLEKYRLS